MSQTSYRLHVGPIASSTWRRSSGVEEMKSRRVPAPSVRPSRTTYAVTIAQKMANQASTMLRPRAMTGRVGAAGDLAPDEDDVEDAEHEVQAREACLLYTSDAADERSS